MRSKRCDGPRNRPDWRSEPCRKRSHAPPALPRAHAVSGARCAGRWPALSASAIRPAIHLARLIAAVKAGLLSKAELAEVVGGLTVVADHVVILERRVACWYCERTGQQLEPCCEHHPRDLVCADRADCKDFMMSQLAETRQA